MKQRHKNLLTAYILVALQFYILVFNDVHDLRTFLIIGSCLLVAASALSQRIKADKRQDFFPQEALYQKKKVNPFILILGKEYEPENHKNESDDRFLRLADRSSTSKLWLSLIIYSATIALIIYYFPPKTFHVYPLLAVIGFTLFTRSHGQLLFLPCFFFLYVFFRLDWSALSSAALFLNSFILCWLTFTCFQLIHLLNKEKPSELGTIKGNAITFSSTISLLFFLLVTLFPQSTSTHDNHEKKKDGALHKLNRNLGRMKISKSDALYNQNLKNLTKNIQNSKLAPTQLNKQLDKMNDRLDKMDSFLKDIPDLSLKVSHEKMNFLTNSQKSLQSELKNLKQEISNSHSASPEQVKKALELMKKIQKQTKKIEQLGFQSSASDKSLEESFKQSLKGAFKETLEEEIEHTGDPDLKKRMTADFPNFFQENTDNVSPEYFDNQVNKAAQTLDQRAKKHEEKLKLFDEESIENFIKFIKYGLISIIIIITLLKLKEYFEEKDELEMEDKLSAQEVKKLLLKRKYASSVIEIRTLFLQFSKAIQKVYYKDEQIPPPQILNSELQRNFVKSKKSLAYFLEVFSLSEYRNQKITMLQLRKYRKAYRMLIKQL